MTAELPKKPWIKLLFNLPSFRLAGSINPKDPSESFFLQVWVLKRVGLWAPETDNQLIQTLYTIYSFVFRWFFLYVYTATQLLFFLTVEDVTVRFIRNLCKILSPELGVKIISALRMSLKDFSCAWLTSHFSIRAKSSTAIAIELKLAISYWEVRSTDLWMKMRIGNDSS